MRVNRIQAYSHSMLSTYENCPRQFKLRYIDRIKPPGGEEWIEAFLGSRVHEVLEKLYKDLILSKTNKLDDLLSYYNDQWEKNWHKGVVITKKGYTKKHYKDSGKRAIRDYYKRHYPFDRDRTLATEKLVYFDIKGYKIRGYIDRFSLAGDGTYEIHDYKTSGSLPPQSKFDSDRQLALYQIGISEQFPKAKNNTRLIWHYLLFDQTFESKRTASELRDLKKNVIFLIKTIENDDDYRPSEGPLCDWCEYPQYCPARKHMFKVNSLPPNKYLKEKGVTIVNKYVSLKSRLDELKKEERSIQEELALLEEVAIKYADKREITSISGSDHILKISRDRIIQFPHSSAEGRDELERYLKKSGLWTVVAGLNTRKLASMVKRGEIDGRKLRAILKFAVEEERVTVKLVRKRGEE